MSEYQSYRTMSCTSYLPLTSSYGNRPAVVHVLTMAFGNCKAFAHTNTTSCHLHGRSAYSAGMSEAREKHGVRSANIIFEYKRSESFGGTRFQVTSASAHCQASVLEASTSLVQACTTCARLSFVAYRESHSSRLRIASCHIKS